MPNEYRMFVEPPGPPSIASIQLDDQPVHEFRTVRVRMPEWATDEMIAKIIRAISKWRYTHTNPTELVVWIPRSWLTERERMAGGGVGPQMIMGVPMLYGPVTEVIVGVRV